jgi:hypothetical protein
MFRWRPGLKTRLARIGARVDRIAGFEDPASIGIRGDDAVDYRRGDE